MSTTITSSSDDTFWQNHARNHADCVLSSDSRLIFFYDHFVDPEWIQHYLTFCGVTPVDLTLSEATITGRYNIRIWLAMPALCNSTGPIGAIPGRAWVCHTTQEMDVLRGHFEDEYILQDVDISISGLSEPVRGYTHIWNKDPSELTPGYQLSDYLPRQYPLVRKPEGESVMAERFAQLARTAIAELYHTPKPLFLPMPGTRELQQRILRFSSVDTRRSEGASASGYITDPSNPSMLIVSDSRSVPIEGYVWTVEETNVLQRAMGYMDMGNKCRLEKIAVTSQSGEEKVVWAFVSVIEQTA